MPVPSSFGKGQHPVRVKAEEDKPTGLPDGTGGDSIAAEHIPPPPSETTDAERRGEAEGSPGTANCRSESGAVDADRDSRGDIPPAQLGIRRPLCPDAKHLQRRGGRQQRRVLYFRTEDIELVVATGLQGKRHASIRPEDILVSTEPLSSSARNSFRGVVTGIADAGTTIYLTVSVPQDFVCLITHRSFEDMNLRQGKAVIYCMPPEVSP